jgi:putative holliday junction resolvase
MTYPTVLAIDFGTQRLGLAISRGTLAEPLLILENNEELLEKLKAICEQEQVTQLVVGVSEGKMEERSRSFGLLISERFDLPVEFADETLSSHQVHEQQKELGKSGPIRTHIDHLAAATFLQEWLDTH